MNQRSVKNAVVVEYQKRRKPTKHYVSIIIIIAYIILMVLSISPMSLFSVLNFNGFDISRSNNIIL